MTKKTKFKIALAVANIDQKAFAISHGVSDVAIIRTLQGQSVSKRLLKAIDDFIDTQFRKLKLAMPS